MPPSTAGQETGANDLGRILEFEDERIVARDLAEATLDFGAFGKDGVQVCFVRINRHGGRIWAESALEQGTTFFFVV